MHYDISFPHLGIHLEHVGKTISVFGFEIAYYGIIIGTAILLGFVIATSEAKRTGQDRRVIWIWECSVLYSGSSEQDYIMCSFPGICTKTIFWKF